MALRMWAFEDPVFLIWLQLRQGKGATTLSAALLTLLLLAVAAPKVPQGQQLGPVLQDFRIVRGVKDAMASVQYATMDLICSKCLRTHVFFTVRYEPQSRKIYITLQLLGATFYTCSKVQTRGRRERNTSVHFRNVCAEHAQHMFSLEQV